MELTNDQPLTTPEPTPSGKVPKFSTRLFVEDLLVTGLGLLTSAAVAYGSYYGGRYHDFAVYTWMAYVIIPMGTILCGIVAAIGYWIGARLFNHRPSRLLMLNIVLVSLTTFFSIHELDYSHTWVKGVPLSEVMSYPTYLVKVTENMRYKSMSHSSSTGDDGTELGKWGWGVAVLQVAGFCLGGFLVYGLLASATYCERCSMYYKRVWHRAIKWKEIGALGQGYKRLEQLIQAGKLQTAIDQHPTMGDGGRMSNGTLGMTLTKCPGCENRQLQLLAQFQRGNQCTTVGHRIVPTQEALQKAAV